MFHKLCLIAKPFCDPDSHAADSEGQAGPIMATAYEQGVNRTERQAAPAERM